MTNISRGPYETRCTEIWRNVVVAGYLAYLASCTTGCASGDMPLANDVGQSEQALWTANGVKYWPDGEVPVCFQPRFDLAGDDEFGTEAYELQTDRIRAVIESSFESLADTSIDFTGWGRCPGGSVEPSRVPGPMLNPGQVNSTALRPAVLGQNFAGGLKIMIQSDEPVGSPHYEPAAYGFQTDPTAGYQGATHQLIMWTAQSTYAWGDNWDSAVEHEAMHALGYEHEWDRDDTSATDCWEDDGATKGSDDGTRLTAYDHDSATNETYCGDMRPGLSDLDKLGLAMTYPDGSPVRIRSGHGFSTSAGLVLRTGDLLETDWTARGATDSVFKLVPTWQWRSLDGQTILNLAPGLTQPSGNLGSIPGTLSGHFTDWQGRRKDLEVLTTIVSNSYHAALITSVL